MKYKEIKKNSLTSLFFFHTKVKIENQTIDYQQGAQPSE